VYFIPLFVDVAPTFEHFVPGVTAASESCAVTSEREIVAIMVASNLRIWKR
jgi:hypothetical protein